MFNDVKNSNSPLEVEDIFSNMDGGPINKKPVNQIPTKLGEVDSKRGSVFSKINKKFILAGAGGLVLVILVAVVAINFSKSSITVIDNSALDVNQAEPIAQVPTEQIVEPAKEAEISTTTVEVNINNDESVIINETNINNNEPIIPADENNIINNEEVVASGEPISNFSNLLDSDKDGLTDEEEVQLGTDPESQDTDNDGLFDREEVRVYRTNPLNADTDGDSFLDGAEVKQGYNPNGLGKLFGS